MTRLRLLLTLLALGAAAGCDRSDPPTGPLRVSMPRPMATVNVLTVDNTNDNGAGSLRQAIIDAQPGDVIHFADAIAGQTVTLTSGELFVGKALTIEGSATAGMTISGGGSSRVATISPVAELTIRNLTIAGGLEATGGAGGGLRNLGTLTIENSAIINNVVAFEAAAAQGGGIWSSADSRLKLVNSTVSGNTSSSSGGGIASYGVLTLIHTTIANNKSTGSSGGGLAVDEGSLVFWNSIIAGNDSYATSNDACRIDASADLTVLGKGIVDAAGCITDPAVTVGDPLLGALANNGGPTKTHAILANSPAIDALATCAPAVTEDQRHVARPQGAGCDVGAYEFTEYLKTPITIAEGVAVNPSNGVAIVTGTLSCTAPITIPLHVELSQPQKSGRATVTAKAAGDITVSCTNVKAWSISLVPPTGTFINGPGSTSAKTTPPGSSVAPASATAAVKLYWARK
jgi:hypothetical protein